MGSLPIPVTGPRLSWTIRFWQRRENGSRLVRHPGRNSQRSTKDIPQQRIEIQYETDSPKIDKILHFNGTETDPGDRLRLPIRRTTTISFPWIRGRTIEYQLITEQEELVDPTDYENPDYPYIKYRKLLKQIVLPELDEFEERETHTFSYDVNGAVSYWQVPAGAEMQYEYERYSTSEHKPYHVAMVMKTFTVDGETYDGVTSASARA